MPVAELLESTDYQKSVYGKMTRYENNFLGTFSVIEDGGFNDKIRVVMSYVMVLYCVVVLFLMYHLRQQKDRYVSVWLGAVILTFFMTLPISKPLWEIIPLLKNIQFPFRIMIVSVVGVAVLIALYMEDLLKKKVINDAVPAFGIIFFFFVLAPWLMIALHAKANVEINLATETPSAKLENELMHAYYPDRRGSLSPERKAAMTTQGLIEMCNQQVIDIDGKKDGIEIRSWKNKEVLFDVSNSVARDIIITQSIFTGWKAEIVDENNSEVKEVLTVGADKEKGLIRLQLPEGEHRVHVYFPRLMIEKIGLAISGFAIVVLMVLYRRADRGIKSTE